MTGRDEAEGSTYRVGEVARQTGITVRTLHHWDQIGLLSPEQRTDAGHRIYRRRDLERLQKIISLRTMGLGLEKITGVLERDSPGLAQVLAAHRDQVHSQVKALERLADRLDRVLAHLSRNGEVTDEQLMRIMEGTRMIEKHFSTEQLNQLAQRRRELGENAIRSAEREWPELISKLQHEMEIGTDPAAPLVQAIAKRWGELVQGFSGGDKGIEESLGNMYREQPKMATRQGLSPELFSYLGKAREAQK